MSLNVSRYNTTGCRHNFFAIIEMLPPKTKLNGFLTNSNLKELTLKVKTKNKCTKQLNKY